MRVTNTALYEVDDDPMIDSDGYPVMSPSFAESAMLSTLEDPPYGEPQAELPPEEAYDLMKFSAPLSSTELAILQRTPFLDRTLHSVDDADHDDWMFQEAHAGKDGLDRALEDTMYGEPTEELTPAERALAAEIEREAAQRRRVLQFDRAIALRDGEDRRSRESIPSMANKLARQRAARRRVEAEISGFLSGAHDRLDAQMASFLGGDFPLQLAAALSGNVVRHYRAVARERGLLPGPGRGQGRR